MRASPSSASGSWRAGALASLGLFVGGVALAVVGYGVALVGVAMVVIGLRGGQARAGASKHYLVGTAQPSSDPVGP